MYVFFQILSLYYHLVVLFAYFEKNPKEAALLISGAKGWEPPEGMDKGDLAAWFFIANILLNLDETITKS